MKSTVDLKPVKAHTFPALYLFRNPEGDGPFVVLATSMNEGMVVQSNNPTRPVGDVAEDGWITFDDAGEWRRLQPGEKVTLENE